MSRSGGDNGPKLSQSPATALPGREHLGLRLFFLYCHCLSPQFHSFITAGPGASEGTWRCSCTINLFWSFLINVLARQLLSSPLAELLNQNPLTSPTLLEKPSASRFLFAFLSGGCDCAEEQEPPQLFHHTRRIQSPRLSSNTHPQQIPLRQEKNPH